VGVQPFLLRFLLERDEMSIKILIVDDQRLFRHGLRSLLEQDKGLEVVGEASDGQDAFTLVQETKPNIILMDVEMPKLDGIHATRLIVERYPNIKILMLSVHNEDERVISAIRSGAVGYIMKDADQKEFIKIIKSTFAGERITSPFLANLTSRIQSKIHEPSLMDEEIEMEIKERFSLTGREKEILMLLLKGKSNKDIADLMFLSTETIKTHLQNIYRKLGVNSRMEVAAIFLKEKE
jgi:two-component system response regulator DegU